jgi:hypothetical protein
MTETERIAARLREALPDVPLIHLRTEGMRGQAGMNVYPFSRPDFPSRSYPCKGTMIRVAYDLGPSDPMSGSTLHAEWVEKVRQFVLAEWPDRYRPLNGLDVSMFLIENPRTKWTRKRIAENAKRAEMGWRGLAEQESRPSVTDPESPTRSAPPIRPCAISQPHERHGWSMVNGPLLNCLGISERTNVAPLGAPPWVTDPAERESMEADRAAALNARAVEQSDPTGLKRGRIYRIRPNIGRDTPQLTLDTREAELFLYGMALAGHTYASQTPVPDTRPLLGKEGP